MLRSSKSNASFRSGTASGSTETNLHPNLGLHSAAASGNIGVVKFALDNGQPHNSILNGLFPLHAACSGGSEAAVRMLLAYGADVNVTRLRVNRGSGGGTGTEGSTPLHYAAANGHTTIVRILLENGARPTARDRDGTTPMSIAAAQGHSTCVALIRSWISAYGSNGLAGPQSSTVDQNNAKLQQPSPFSTMRTQRSFESLSSAAAGVKATLRNHKKQALAKVSSNPNLRSLASNSSPPSPPPPVPTASRTSSQNVPQSTPPQTLSSVPTSIARESKRRPSLPSILERAAQSSSAFRNALSTHSSQANQPDSIEELSPEEAGQKPPHSPIRTTHALASKRSLTGLLSKTSNNNSEDVTKPQSLNSSPLSLPRSSAARSRSGSVDVFAQSPVNHLARPDMSILQSSPTSSLDTVDNSTKQSSPASHAFRPRKSSNLSSTIHTLPLGEQSVVDYDAEHGRKRSQSATSLPKRSSPVPEREDSSKSLHSQRPSQRQQLDNHSDETKEFISTSSHSSLKERSSTPTRYRSSNRSPLVPSKMLSEESDLRNGGFLSTDPASPSLGFRQLHSQTSTSSLVSTSSSNNTNPRQPRMSSTSTTDTCGEEESKMYLEPRSMTRSNRSTSYSESTASKTSTTSARSFGAGLTAQEQAQAILRSADHNGPSSSSSSSSSYGVPAISLTQMLASYGEALAQERRGTSPQYQIPASLRTQAGLASSGSAGLGHQLRSVSENHLSPSSDSTSTNKVHPGSITPVSTPPDSPQTTRSRAESSATSFSRSPSSNRQKVTPKDLNKVTAGECWGSKNQIVVSM